MATNHQVSFVLGAALAAGFGKAFSAAANTMGQLQRRTGELGKAQAELQKYQKLRMDTKDAATQLVDARTKTESFRQTLAAAETNTRTLQTAFNVAASRSTALKNSLDAQKAAHAAAKSEVQRLSTAIKGSTNPTREMRDALGAARQRAVELGQGVKSSQAAFQAARAETTQLGKSLRQAQGETKNAQNNFSTASGAASKLGTSIKQQGQELRSLGNSLRNAGINTKNLTAEQARLEKQSNRIAQAQSRLQQSKAALAQTKQSLSISNISGEVMAAMGMFRLLKAPVMTAANFEQAMAKVQAVSGASEADLKSLTEQARQLGKDTQFSATQAAQGQELLARAGFKSNEIIASMPGLLNMAAAEGMDLAQAADIASNTLRGFNLPAEQTLRVADVLAKASASSNVSIASLGESMKMVAPVASGLGISIEEATAMIGAMGNAGIKGSEAGTALRGALIRLSKEPKATEEALNRMGISAKDAQGNLRKMPDLMKALSQRMKDMGEADKMEVLSKIFGTEASAGMLAIMSAVESGKLESLEDGLRNAAGASEEMARIMNNTAQGAMKRLGSATESILIDLGNALLPAFTEFVDVLAKGASAVSDFAQKHPKITTAITTSVAALGAFNVASTATSIAIRMIRLPFQQLRVVIDSARGVMVLFGNSTAWLAVKQRAVAATARGWELAQAGLNRVMGLGQALWDGVKLMAFHAKQLLIAGSARAWAAAQWLLNAAMNANPIALIVTAIAGLVTAGWYLYKNWDAVSTGIVNAWNWIWSKIEAFGAWLGGAFSWDGLIAGWETVKNAFAAIPGQIMEALAGVGEAIKAPFREAFKWIFDKLEAIKGAWEKVAEFFSLSGEETEEARNNGSTGVGGIGSAARAAAGLNAEGNVRRRAMGGLVSSPQLSLIGEAGAEMVIPLERQARGRALWMQAGEMLGMISKTGGAMAAPKAIPEFQGSGMPLYKAAEGLSSGDTVNNNTANHSQYNGGDINLHITVEGGGEKEESLARKIGEEVRRILRETQEYNQRVSYA